MAKKHDAYNFARSNGVDMDREVAIETLVQINLATSWKN